MRLKYSLLTIIFLISCTAKKSYVEKEGYDWLEEVRGRDAMEWVKNENSLTTKHFEKTSYFEKLKEQNLEILNDKDKIAYPSSVINGQVYNLWKDEKNPKGLLRRKSVENYRNDTGQWETVLDFDLLAKKEKRTWFYRGLNCYKNASPCMMGLSPEGTDARAQREFDLKEKKFVEEGFKFPASKSSFTYVNENLILISDAINKATQTDSGYAMVVKTHRRGRPLNRAEAVYTGERSDVYAGAGSVFDPKTSRSYYFIQRAKTFYTSEYFLFDKDFRTQKMGIPDSARFEGVFADQIFVKTNTEWKVGRKTFKAGSLVSFPYSEFAKPKNVKAIYTPNKKSSFQGLYVTKDNLFIKAFSNVMQKFYRVEENFKLTEIKLPSDFGSFYLRGTSPYSNDVFLSFQSLLNPNTLYSLANNKLTKIKSLKSYFKTAGLVEKRFFTKSKDGVEVPYTIVHRENIKLDGNNPTLIYGYGGFRVSMTPYYSADLGKFWLEKGGVYVLTHIRGGGEYGPSWHAAALKRKRQTAYNDFYAIAEDVIKRKITNPNKVGILGGSNGGLLTTVAFNQRPDLYKAVISAVPLTDMLRFHKLLAGASWVGEYGSPEIPEEKEFLKTISPFHNIGPLKKESPWLFMKTNTSDDRVHPAHARKMAKKAKAYGHKTFYYENTQGGHGGRDNYEQRATSKALEYSFLYEALGVTL